MLTLINKGEVASVLHLDTGSRSREASVIRLTGPAIDAKKEIMLGGTAVTSRGTWKACSQACRRASRPFTPVLTPASIVPRI